MKRGRYITAAILLGLSACTVVVDEPNPPRPGVYPPPGPGPGICTREFRPVCAERYGERQSFPNDCVAEARGFRVVYDGECRRIRPPQYSEPLPPPRPGGGGVVCPQIYAPVCARQGNILRTFSNECVADATGFDVVGDGPC